MTKKICDTCGCANRMACGYKEQHQQVLRKYLWSWIFTNDHGALYQFTSVCLQIVWHGKTRIGTAFAFYGRLTFYVKPSLANCTRFWLLTQLRGKDESSSKQKTVRVSDSQSVWQTCWQSHQLVENLPLFCFHPTPSFILTNLLCVF